MSLEEEFSRLDLANVAGGAAPELFGRCMSQVLQNVQDESCSPDAARTISLKFKISPNKDRMSATISVESHVSLAQVESVAGNIYMRREKGKTVAYAHNVHQPDLPFPSEVTPLGAADRAGNSHK